MNGHPSPPPTVEAEGFFSGIRPLALVIGVLVDHVSTMLLGIATLGIVAALYGRGDGAVLDEQAALELAFKPGVLAAWMLVGSFCTGLGGFMAGRMAARQRVQHGAFVGLAGIVVGLLSYGDTAVVGQPPLWFDLMKFGVLVPAGALGGWVSGLSRTPPARGDADNGPDQTDRRY